MIRGIPRARAQSCPFRGGSFPSRRSHRVPLAHFRSVSAIDETRVRGRVRATDARVSIRREFGFSGAREASCHLQDLEDRFRDAFKVFSFARKLLLTGGCERVEARAPIIFRGAPFG